VAATNIAKKAAVGMARLIIATLLLWPTETEAEIIGLSLNNLISLRFIVASGGIDLQLSEAYCRPSRSRKSPNPAAEREKQKTDEPCVIQPAKTRI
jgi:hypothetical protein